MSPQTQYPTSQPLWLVLLLASASLLCILLPSFVQPAHAQEGPGAGAVEAGEGTVRIGDDVFAGDGCARVGNVVAGDCDEDPEGTEPSRGESTQKPERTIEPTSEQPADQTDDRPGDTRGETTATTPGETTGDAPPDPESCRAAPPADALQATVARAVDGDTLELQEPVQVGSGQDYDRVRLIGVNTPEMEGDEGVPEPGAEEASDFTAAALEGEEVRLETDEELEDPNGRLLAYVWVEPENAEPELFNETLLEQGYADIMVVEPNDAYAGCLAEALGAGGWEEQPGATTTGEPQGEAPTGQGILNRIRELLSSEDATHEPADETTNETTYETTNETADEPDNAGDQYSEPGSTTETPSGTRAEPSDSPGIAVQEQAGKATSGSTMPAATPDGPSDGVPAAGDPVGLAEIPPEACPGADLVLEPFAADEIGQSPPFEITGGSFVVRADLQTDHPTDAALDVSILDTEEQAPVEEFDQRAAGSYDTLVDRGPGEYLLNLEPRHASYELVVFDCAEEEAAAPAKEPVQDSERPAQQEPTANDPVEAEPQARLEFGPQAPPRPDGPAPEPSQAPASPQPVELAAQEPAEPSEESTEESPPAPAAEPSVDLPTRDTPSGTVAVLPATGGLPPPILLFVASALLVAAGTAGLTLQLVQRRPGSRRW